MAPSSIELKVSSCKDLKAFNFFQKLSVYAIVSIASDNDREQKKQKTVHHKQKTPVDREGDGNPEWNHEIRFDLKEISSLDLDNLFLEFHLFSEVILFGDKTIGEVRVPFKDLAEESKGFVRFVSYQVRSIDGNSNGVLNFSYKVIDENKIGSIYPTIENTGSTLDFPPPGVCHARPESVNPPPEVCYPRPEFQNPSPEVCYPQVQVYNPSSEHGGCYPPPRIQYPQPESCYPPIEIHYPSPENYFMVQPQPSSPPPLQPLPPATFLPPEPVYSPASAFVYPLCSGLAPYGFGSGGHNYPICAYPTNAVCQELEPSWHGEIWCNASQHRGRIAGYWDAR